MAHASLLHRVGIPIWFVIYHCLIFVVVPSLFVEWNAELGWPVWRTAVSSAIGVVTILIGVGVIAYCTGVFALVGKGTPVPVAPPETLVIRGLFRYSRNPIYVADVLIWLGIFFWQGHLALLLLTAIAAGVIQVVVVFSEEPGLRRRFGSEFENYCMRVPRWVRVTRSSS